MAEREKKGVERVKIGVKVKLDEGECRIMMLIYFQHLIILFIPFFTSSTTITFSTITSHFSSSLTRSSTSVHNTYITYNITNISCSLLCSSSITSCTFDLEHTTPFVSIVGVKPLQRQSVISCTSINDVTIHIIGLCILYSGSINKCSTLKVLFVFIVIYRLVNDVCYRANAQHLQESVAGLTSARCVEHLIEVRCSL